MAALTERELYDILRQAKVPGLDSDIVSLGLVSKAAVVGDRLQVLIDLTSRPHLAPPVLEAAIKEALYLRAETLPVDILVTAHAPAPTLRPSPRASRTPIEGVRHMIAVASGKGGVGKSTTAVNVALSLSRMGLAVGLMDADIYGPSVPRLMGINGAPAITGRQTMEPLTHHGIKVMSMGFLVPEDKAMIWRGPMVMGAIKQLLRQVAWGALDVLVIDMPPGTGDAHLTLVQDVPLSGAVIVSTPQDIALLDARRGIAMFQQTGTPVLGLIENMSFFCCPQCGHRTDIFHHGGAQQAAKELGIPFLGEVPLHLSIRETSDAGLPITLNQPDGSLAQAYRQIAERIWITLSVH